MLPLAALVLAAGVAQAAGKPPNIVFVLVDDQGWTDLGVRMDSGVANSGSDFYETPNIDALARRSLRFSSGYSPSPICTPSRASILTGKSPQALGFTDILESRPGSRRFSDLYAGKPLVGPLPVDGLPDGEVTYAEFIRDRVDEDYALAHFGKWHVGGGGPGRHGFEAHDGSTGNHNLSAHSGDPNPKDVFGITARAIMFMTAQVYSGRPFVVQLSHYANHVPLSAMRDTIAKYRSKEPGARHDNPVYAALNEDLDSSVGRLVEAIRELGIKEDTWIVFISDNGGSMNLRNPSTNNAPLREGKTWLYEGGIRVPFMVSGPGVEPGETAVPVVGQDLFPTFCAILGCDGPLPDGIEGGNLLPVLRGEASRVERRFGDALYWHFPHYLSAKGTTPHSAVRSGDFKLVRFYHPESSRLYHLGNDIGETRDVSQRYPEIAASLEARLSSHLAEVGARMAVANPGAAAADAIAVDRRASEPADPVSLESRHTSVFSRIRYRIPGGWVVVDGETDWLAPSDAKQFWHPGFDPARDTCFAVSSLPPYLSLDDRAANRMRSLEEFARANAQALQIAAGAEIVGPLTRLRLDGNAAIAVHAEMNGAHAHYQVFVRIAADEIATVAAHGPKLQLPANIALVQSIAATIESGGRDAG